MQGWSLNPGRYVGVAERAADDFDFAGRSLTTKQIYDEHNIGKPFILKNYQNILKKLEANGKVKTEPSADKRRKIKGEVTFSKNVKVTFPPREA